MKSPVVIQSLRAGMNRRNAMRLMAAGVIGSVADAAWIEPGSLSVTREDVVCGKLPPGLDGLKIVLLADFHYRPDEDEDLMDRVIAQVCGEKPDLVALAGDFISSDSDVLRPLLGKLGKLNAAHGVFAVMGNHDGWCGDRSVIRRQIEKAGISFLNNGHSRISIRGESLAVAGTDFVWHGKPDAAGTLRGIAAETPIVALVHEPDYFDVMTAQREILLQVSGHTHGGQCRVPLLGFAPYTPKFGRKYIHGAFAKGQSNLFVTRGVGTTGPRVRFACPPEIAVLTLRSLQGHG